MSPLVLVLLIILLVALFGGGLGYGRMGAVSFGPVGLVLLILLVLYLAGYLR